MPVYSDNQHGRFQRRFSQLRLRHYKSTPLWLFLASVVIGTGIAGFLIVRDFNIEINRDELPPASLLAKVFDTFNKNQYSLRVNFLFGKSDNPAMPNPSVKGRMELDKNRQPFNLELQLLDGPYQQIQPTIKTMPLQRSNFLKLNLSAKVDQLAEPLVLIASLPPYQAITPNTQMIYQATSSTRPSANLLQILNQQLSDSIAQTVNQRWIKLDNQITEYLLASDPQQAIDLCFLSEGVFYNYNFWDFSNHSINSQQQKVLELKFNQAKFVAISKTHSKHRCFSQIKTDQLRENTIDKLKDLRLLVTINQSTFLPQTILITKEPAADASVGDSSVTYHGRFDFNFLPDGIDSSEPTDVIYLPHLIKQLDQQVGDFLGKK